ncbi:MAG: LCP family protein, partial [Anaerolineae bacterium]|nr:LCP family protein [Anaerolineae bacterium]
MSSRPWIVVALVAATICALLGGLLSCRGVVSDATSHHSTPTHGPVALSPTATELQPSLPAPSGAPTPGSSTSLGASSSPTPSAEVPATATSKPSPTSTSTPYATPTSTPFPTRDSTPIALDRPVLIKITPTLSDTTPIPTPVPVAQVPPNTINIVLLGSDRRPDWDEWHTDVVQVVSVQPALPAVTVLSIPRDLYVYVPDFWMSRVNFADMYGELYGYQGGGPALIQQTLLYNLGIPVDHYVRVDFDGFIGIVDIL